MAIPEFTGVYPILPTPFNDDESLDSEAFANIDESLDSEAFANILNS